MKKPMCHPRYRWIAVLAAMIGGVMSGCAVGPDFRTPTDPVAGSYTAAPLLQNKTGIPGEDTGSQRLVHGRELPAQWWQLFHNPALDRLIRQALSDSPTLAVAGATLRQAQENLRAQKGVVYFPAIDASLTGTRQKAIGAAFGQPYGICMHEGVHL